ncbi:hypothetical protein FOCC_FOCC016257 [Frankliniella occidentalis]|nr:hypothetical protein FOCC_FOCC016257 [Frankliniella occidentalis]
MFLLLYASILLDVSIIKADLFSVVSPLLFKSRKLFVTYVLLIFSGMFQYLSNDGWVITVLLKFVFHERFYKLAFSICVEAASLALWSLFHHYVCDDDGAKQISVHGCSQMCSDVYIFHIPFTICMCLYF